MAPKNTVLSQMLQLLPRQVFEHQVETHSWQGPTPRKLSYWSQLVAMLYAQLSAKKSLRDLVFSLGRHHQKLYHLGLAPVKRSTLADANEQRPAQVFTQTYFKLLSRLEAELSRQSGPRRVKIMDATYVPVCDSLFPWADFMPGKSAVKLHFLLDAEAGTPQALHVTSGQVHELEVARALSFAPGDLLLLDRGYVDFAWLYSLHQQAVGFVTRLPGNIRYQVVRDNPVPADSPVLADQTIRLSTAYSRSRYPATLRLVHYREPETGKNYIFLTNRPDLAALAVADLYRQRWQIETFFRWIKQNLKIKAFYGTSENAVLIQIWTAMIAYLLLLWLKLRSWAGWSVLELTRLVQNLIMERCNLWALLCPRTSDPPDYGQLTLFNLGGTT
ncbi:MAG: IS4 family transposase [Deltaproteobacteria bacterium]|nr:IS4 family transposase [Deltaproteobacteria bacterium]